MFSYFSSRCHLSFLFFFFNDTATTEIYTLSLHDALPICFSVYPLGLVAGQLSLAPKFGGSVQPRAQRIDQKGGPGRQKNGAKEQKSTGHPFPPEPFLNRVQRTASSTCGRSSPANGRAA